MRRPARAAPRGRQAATSTPPLAASRDADQAPCPGPRHAACGLASPGLVAQTGTSQAGVGIGILTLGCFQWFPASRSWGGSSLDHISVKTGGVVPAFVTSTCTGGTRPARGIRGRHGMVVDSFGLRCAAP